MRSTARPAISTDTISRDILTDSFSEAQTAITARLDEILDACMVKDFDRLTAYHLTGPKFSTFDDLEPLGRQDDETAMHSEVEASAPSMTSMRTPRI